MIEKGRKGKNYLFRLGDYRKVTSPELLWVRDCVKMLDLGLTTKVQQYNSNNIVLLYPTISIGSTVAVRKITLKRFLNK
jgi:hypothetical protein